METVCIAGSRHWYGADCLMSLYATLRGDLTPFDVAQRDILIGDAEGIDTWALHLAQSFPVHLCIRHVAVYHIGARPRNHLQITRNTNIVRVKCAENSPVRPYTQRDQKMIDDLGERGQWIGFWNGDAGSQGTLSGFEYAKLHSKTARLYRWNPEKSLFELHMSSGVPNVRP